MRASLLLARGGELGERALADTEHLVTGLEAGDLTADCDHHTRHVETGNRVLGRAQADRQARGIGHAGHQMPGAPVEAGGMNLHQHLVGADRRPLDLGLMQHIGRAVLVLDDRPHPLAGLGTRRRRLLGRCCRWHCHLVSSLLSRPAGDTSESLQLVISLSPAARPHLASAHCAAHVPSGAHLVEINAGVVAEPAPLNRALDQDLPSTFACRHDGGRFRRAWGRCRSG